jgi:Na+-transporting methylmalonyl-CoA/oxaloacetate decarboxylase gamma subunit
MQQHAASWQQKCAAGDLVIAAAVTHNSSVHEHSRLERLLMFGSSMQQHAAAYQQKHAVGVVAIAAAVSHHSSVPEHWD